MNKIKLNNIDTVAPKNLSKESTKKELLKLKMRLEELQNLLYAESKHSVLIILQGMDASGKDGVVKNVLNTMNPMGCMVFPFKAPSELESKHDFLWRIHNKVPEKGMIHVFNRSHYEDVLIQRVHHWVNEKKIKERYEHINNFEKLIKDSGTAILKFYLHISKKEQMERLEERLSDKSKMWKYNETDLQEREYWSHYMHAYESAFENCSVHCDWHIIPSDQNWYKEYLIAKRVVETLEGFKMKFPGLKAK